MKLEGIVHKERVVAQEVLFSGFKDLNGLVVNNDIFFSSLTHPDVDFSIFEVHLTLIWKLYESGQLPPPYRFFVNLKPYTLLSKWQDVNHLLSHFPFLVIVELQEDAISPHELKEIKKLRESYRFYLSLDDFGRAASNFDRVIELKPEFIKLDLKVLNGVSFDALSYIVSGLTNILSKTKLIAEKVETESDYQNIASLGVELFQGFYFGKPKVLDICYEKDLTSRSGF